jgi:hypothetical protein
MLSALEAYEKANIIFSLLEENQTLIAVISMDTEEGLAEEWTFVYYDISITIYYNDTYELDFFNSSQDLLDQKPITNWNIDSDKAYEIMRKEYGRTYIIGYPKKFHLDFHQRLNCSVWYIEYPIILGTRTIYINANNGTIM